MIAGSLAGGLVVIFAASSMMGHRSGEVPVVQAAAGPVRVKPENPGGLQVANANNEIFSGGNDTDGSKLAPAPEMPDPSALRDQPPQASQPPAPAMIAAPPSPPALVPRPRTARPARIAAEPPAARPAQAVPEPPSARSTPPAVATARLSPVKAETHVLPPPAEKAPAERAPAPPVASRAPVVQLAALTTEDAARLQWQQLARRMPELLGSRQPSYSRVEHDGHTFWRLRTAGFTDAAQARTFCEHVRAKGGACALADF